MIAQILVAEDDKDLANVIQDYLEGQGHRVVVVHDGTQVVLKAMEHRPHLIIMDIMMPGAYGSTAYEALQKEPNTKDIPILFISGSDPKAVAKIIPQNNPKTKFLKKPMELPQLDKIIQELLPLGGYTP